MQELFILGQPSLYLTIQNRHINALEANLALSGTTQQVHHTVKKLQVHVPLWKWNGNRLLLLFSILSDDRFKASSKTIPPHSAIQSLLFQRRVSSPVLKVMQWLLTSSSSSSCHFHLSLYLSKIDGQWKIEYAYW